MASNKGLDMTTGPIFKKLLLFAYPMMINGLVNTLYGIADQVIAGQYIGDTAIAAVGTGVPAINLFFNTLMAVSAGVGVLCGNFIGGNQKEDLRKCMHCAPVIGLVFGLLLGLIGIFGTRPILITMDTPDSVLSSATTYMTIRMIGMSVALVSGYCSCIFSAHGDTKRTTVISLISGTLNVIGNIVFVTLLPMGIAGIALSTVLSETFSLGIKLYILFSPKDLYQLRFKELRIHPDLTKQILRIGLPNGLNSVAFNLSNVILQSSVNSLGATILAGNAAADTLTSIVTMIPSPFNSASGCAVAQCYGAGNFKRIKETVRTSLLGTTIIIIVACTIVMVFAMPLMRMFTDSEEVARAGIPKLMFTTWSYVLYIFVLIYGGALTGIRRSGEMMIRNLLGICIPRVLWVWFIFPLFGTPSSLYMVYPVSYFICALLLGLAFRRNVQRLMAEHHPIAAQ